MTDSTTTMIVLGTARTHVLTTYSPKFPSVHALVMLSRENDENRPNGFERTSACVLRALDTARTIGNSVTSDSPISRACLPPRVSRLRERDAEAVVMRLSDTATSAAGAGSGRS